MLVIVGVVAVVDVVGVVAVGVLLNCWRCNDC